MSKRDAEPPPAQNVSDPRHDVYRPYRCVVVAYVRLPPPLDQRDAVEHYWMVEAPGSPSEVKREILIPNGRPGLAIALAEPGVRQDPVTSERWTNDAALFGLMTRPHVLSQTGMSSYVGAELKPWGIAALGLSDRLVDGVLPVAAWTDAGTTRRLARELADLEFGQPRADRLAGFVGERLQVVRPMLKPRSRHLHGYYDQAHAARDFKRYTGVSASSFQAVQKGIAELMHGRSVQDG